MNRNKIHQKAQIVYLSHGGGPLPILGDGSHQAMIDFMVQLPSLLKKPDAILVISAHWEEHVATLLSPASPTLFYDYYGFPEEAYAITYPVPGNTDLAARIIGLLNQNEIPARIDTRRGFDHGLFIPLKIMYPEADIPALQLSLLRGLDPVAHVLLGKALRALLDDNILVIGSGFSFHNMGAFNWEGGRRPDASNDSFQDWLIETCTGPLSLSDRQQRLIEWQKAPGARYCHPREEHLLPIHVCAGMADEAATKIFDDYIIGKRSIALLW
ncbi:MAG: 4,5-DOPA dioxygenase extradiol [Syntrophus sp. SKADARSKE-3]|nr:4,5-DOPA dioxygenase extradiol [Syntrophus sp. SKADARSKE-3]